MLVKFSTNPVSDVISDLRDLIITRSAQGKDVHIGLTGGKAGMQITSALLNDADLMANPHVHLWWSDERFLPQADSERNDRDVEKIDTATRARIHRVAFADTFITVDQAAAQYAAELHQHTTTRFCASNTLMDVTILSVGPDGHVASLFPHHDALSSTLGVVAITDSPKPPPMRVTWTYPTINASEQVWLLAVGKEKIQPISQLLAGTTPGDIPAAGVHGKNATALYTDIQIG